MNFHEPKKEIEFDSIRLRVASPEAILNWSHGEVTKPETINYRTQKPEKDGLFDERIFGPTKDWECYCGKYKRIRYKGIVCDKCGVEVTRSVVRRERMGHISLAAPVSHIWFLRGVPSKIGLVLDISIQDLEKVIYFASFVVTSVDEAARVETLKQVGEEFKLKKKQIESEWQQNVNQTKTQAGQAKESAALDKVKELTKLRDERLKDLTDALDLAKKELKDLRPMQIISEHVYQDLSLKYGHIFEASIGAEAIYALLKDMDLAEVVKVLEQEAKSTVPSKKKRILKRLKLLKSFVAQNLRPEWMILQAIPVIPPDLRPMVQLDGGRFAASDLNDLYRRVINRSNRLKRLIELNAPEVITRNEKRMLQEAVDALIDNNARHGKTVTASTGQKRMLKSLADILKGKQGRFRQNLLGKRVDYSGRSVIVAGPHLKLHQCGLPKRMALELFRPFVISKLIQRELVHNVRSANRFIEAGHSEIWDILEEITKKSHVMLNRAPTLHRLSIQAFQPLLIEGKAIQIHPLVCPAFNADFDGDQMAVHVPLTEQAKEEAAELMLSSNNLLKPATGDPVITPSQDVVLGCYYLTYLVEAKDRQPLILDSPEEAMAYAVLGRTHLHDKIIVRLNNKQRVETTAGRLYFNTILPKELGFINKTLLKKDLKDILSSSIELMGNEKTAELLDNMKSLALEHLTRSGISWGMDDLPLLSKKADMVAAGDKEVDEIETHYEQGLLTDEERHVKVIEVWARVKDEITKHSKESLDPTGSVSFMINSGARGSWGQLTQMVGMKGLVTNPSGDTIELPVKGSFKEGFDVLEFFISTHGARKGLADTALRTANAGYLTRRLIDVAQEVVIQEKDCGDKEGLTITRAETEDMGETLIERIKGRVLAASLKNSAGKILAKRGELITQKKVRALVSEEITEATIRSALTCLATRTLCGTCYGWDLGRNQQVEPGVAVGIIAAQSIGEPGTQLTMRTFHTGGVAGADITQGLPRVEEIFEARPVKKAAVIAPIAGEVELAEADGNIRQKIIKISGKQIQVEKVPLTDEQVDKLSVKPGKKVKKGDVLVDDKDKPVLAPVAGKIEIEEEEGTHIKISQEKSVIKELPVPSGFAVWVRDGDMVEAGDQLSEGSLDLHELFVLKGKNAVQRYIIKEIQYIYSSQGQKLNDKHIEIISRQMFSRVLIQDAGDSDFLPGQVVDSSELNEITENLMKEKGKGLPRAKDLLLGITKASLSTSSFLSAASFQETARVLIDAAVTGKVDRLRGLKENVIIGRLIPAGTGFRKMP